MKKLTTLIVTALVLLTACRGRHSATHTDVQNEEPIVPAGPTSTVHMNDTAVASQLTKGFYAVEGSAWRWTAGHFSVSLKTPAGSAQKGAVVTLTFTVPEAIISKAKGKTLTVTASTGGKDLNAQKYTKSGNYSLEAEVPAAALTQDTIVIDFVVDNPLPANPGDVRELGVIASQVSIESK